MPSYSSSPPQPLWLTFLLCLLLQTLPIFASTANADDRVVGAVDALVKSRNVITLQGWAGALNPSDEIRNIEVRLGETRVYETTYESLDHFPRPDVNKALERSDWLKPGWRLTFTVPSKLSTGVYPLEVAVTTASGKRFVIDTNPSTKEFSYKKPSLTKRLKGYIIPVLSIAIASLLALLFFRADRVAIRASKKINRQLHPAVVFGAGVVIVFAALVLAGITGSSFGLGVKQIPFVDSNVKVLWGDEQPIRSDEWLIQTPNAIAQANHIPPFPIINTNLGKDGQNMLIPGMTGEPVAHISQVVKPATWGFYVFDLKRALSWNWMFPIFGCLLAFWAVLCNLSPGAWRQNFIASLCFSTAAYVVAWSNWPAYTLFFPCIIYLLAIRILSTNNTKAIAAQAILLGLAFAGFVLVLYPPWQISVTYIFIAITIGKLAQDNLYRRFNLLKIGAYCLSFGIAGVILYAWWNDAHSAIEAMENTIYPGKRTTLLGGDATLDFLFRGFTNLSTINSLSSPVSNPSEIASFYYLLLPLLTLFCLRVYQRTTSAVEIALACGIAFTLYFMFYGIPVFLAEYSLWGRVPGKRADLALGLACLIMAALLGGARHQKNQVNANYLNILAFGSALIWTALGYITVYKMHDSILSEFKTGAQVIVFSCIMLSGYLLARGSVKAHFAVLFVLSAMTTYAFNPIIAAPNYVSAKTPDLKGHDIKRDRVIALDSSTPAMYLLASGAKVLNGIFYYPQKTIWSQLDPDGSSASIYNRYQHLRFYANDELKPPQLFKLENPGPDRVEVGLSAEAFDFSSVSADLVVAPTAVTRLKANNSLTFIASENGWTWYSVKR